MIAFSACTDFYLAIYPCTIMYKLQISKKSKVGLSAVLSLGIMLVLRGQRIVLKS